MTMIMTVQVRVAPLDCYACGAETKMIASLALLAGGKSICCSITDLGQFPLLVKEIVNSLNGREAIGTIKPRFSQSWKREYLSNGCLHCDALFGAHFEIHSRYDEYVAAQFDGQHIEEWIRLVEALEASEDGHLI